MPHVVLVRAVSVGGHHAARPAAIAKALARFHVVNVGAAGTFATRASTSAPALQKAVLAELGFETDVVVRPGTEVGRFIEAAPRLAKGETISTPPPW